MTSKNYWYLRLLSAAVLCAVAVSARAQCTVDDLVTTHHQIVVGGKTLSYTATAGHLPILNNDAGEARGYMFFVAYTLDRAPGQPVRPLTFVWNGGPGSSASEVHLMGFGPRRLKMGDTYPASVPLSAQTGFEDNQETWLDFSDLVFVDPIGTGYSRPTRAEYGAEFYNTVGDAESVAEFIRVYRLRFDAFDAPVFLAGESYGTIRAHWVAEALERRRTLVAGIALISGFIHLGQKVPPAMATALELPRFTTTAYYHKKLPRDLQSGTLQDAVEKANRWARTEYAPALERRESLNPLTPTERESVIAQLARFAGVKPSLVDPKTLAIFVSDFTDRLLQDQGRDLGRYDARMTAPRDVTKIPWTTTVDPSLSPVMDVMQGTSPSLLRYWRSELQYKSDLAYRGPFGGAYPAPTVPNGDWMAMHWSQDKEPDGVPAYAPAPGEPTASIPLVPPLRRAMELNPSMRVLVLTGMYDNAVPEIGCDLAAYTISLVDPQLRERVATRCYVGGHMMYTDKVARQEIRRDVAKLVREAVAASSSKPPQ